MQLTQLTQLTATHETSSHNLQCFTQHTQHLIAYPHPQTSLLVKQKLYGSPVKKCWRTALKHSIMWPLLPCNALCTIDLSLLSHPFTSKTRWSAKCISLPIGSQCSWAFDQSEDSVSQVMEWRIRRVQWRCTFEGTQSGTNVHWWLNIKTHCLKISQKEGCDTPPVIWAETAILSFKLSVTVFFSQICGIQTFFWPSDRTVEAAALPLERFLPVFVSFCGQNLSQLSSTTTAEKGEWAHNLHCLQITNLNLFKKMKEKNVENTNTKNYCYQQQQKRHVVHSSRLFTANRLYHISSPKG